MKKIIASFLSIMILTIGLILPTTVFAEENSEYVAYKITAPLNSAEHYDSSLKSITLHYGVNGWNDIKDIKMERVVRDMYLGKTFVDFQATIVVKKNATVNYDFKKDFYNKESVWDNNNGKNYSVTVVKTNLSEYEKLIPIKVTKTYDYSSYGTHYINSVTLHYGVDGWKNATDVEMTRTYVGYNTPNCKVVYTATVYVKRGSVLDYSLKKDAGSLGVYWDNNNGKDYHIFASDVTTSQN